MQAGAKHGIESVSRGTAAAPTLICTYMCPPRRLRQDRAATATDLSPSQNSNCTWLFVNCTTYRHKTPAPTCFCCPPCHPQCSWRVPSLEIGTQQHVEGPGPWHQASCLHATECCLSTIDVAVTGCTLQPPACSSMRQHSMSQPTLVQSVA